MCVEVSTRCQLCIVSVDFDTFVAGTVVSLEGGFGFTERRSFADLLGFVVRGLAFVITDRWDDALFQNITLREFHRPLDSGSCSRPKIRAGIKTVCCDLRCICR